MKMSHENEYTLLNGVTARRAESTQEWQAVHEWLCCTDCGDVECFDYACNEPGIDAPSGFIAAMDASHA